MSWTARHRSILIGTNPVLSGSATLIDEQPTLTESGWDNLRLLYALRTATLSAEDCHSLFPRGTQVGTRKFWVTGSQPKKLAAGFWQIEVDCLGWAGNKPAKVTVGASAETQSGQNATGPNESGIPTLFGRVMVHENVPTVSVSYLAEGLNTSSNTEFVGRALALPTGIVVPVPDGVWNALPDFTYHWPNGWVLMESAQDRIPGTDVGLVTDSLRYIRARTP